MKLFHRVAIISLFFIFSTVSLALANSQTHNTVVILLDSSGSMRQSDPQCLRKEAVNLLISQMRNGDKVVIAEFGDGIRQLSNGLMTLSDETRQNLQQALGRCSAKDNYTDILGALNYAQKLLSALPLEIRESYPPSIIFLTDGRDQVPGNPNRTNLIENKARELANLPVVIHTVGFSRTADLPLLRKMSDLTGGNLCPVERVQDLIGSFFGLSRILGNRWSIEEKVVTPGMVNIDVPHWAKSLIVCYLPAEISEGLLRATPSPVQTLQREYYQIFRIEPSEKTTINLNVPVKGGKILVDAEGQIILQPLTGSKVPANIPFLILTRLLPAVHGDLGKPFFLANTTVSLLWEKKTSPTESISLYDDGQHEDLNPEDGVFGGYALLSQPGPYSFRLTARAPLSPTLSYTGTLQALEPAITVHFPGFWSKNILAFLKRKISFEITNLTDINLKGGFLKSSSEEQDSSMAVNLASGKTQDIVINVSPHLIRQTKVTGKLVLAGMKEPVWQGYLTIPALIWVIIWPLAVIALVILSLIFPRRPPKGTILVKGESHGQDFTEVIKIGTNGHPIPNQKVPPPFNTPGTFQARSGCWKRGIIYYPYTGFSPQFIREHPPRVKNGFLLKKTVMWSCRSQDGKAQYTFRP